MTGVDCVTFSEEDCEVFSRASGDRNPLHLDTEYARVTPFGQRVVFGCLGAIASLARIRIPSGWAVTSLDAEFVRPVFLGLIYRFDIAGKDGEWTVRLFDGTLMLASLRIKAAPGPQLSIIETKEPRFALSEALSRNPADLIQGLRTTSEYATDPSALAVSRARWGDFDPLLGTALCCCSYAVGMDLPGKTALFSKLSLQFANSVPAGDQMSYTASIASVNPKIGQIRMDFNLRGAEGPIASGKLWSFIRPELADSKGKVAAAVKTRSLAGRTALIIGASRGLGAALQDALENRAAAVYTLSRSKRADAVRAEAGDAADIEVLRRFKKGVTAEQRRIDFLICNACPAIPPLRMEENTLQRIRQYVDQAIALTLAPLCEFLDELNASAGCAVIISSSAVEQPVREWPHYIAAKQAVEGIAQVAVLQYPQISSLIVRPHKMLTTMTDTPTGRIGAEPPERCAERIAVRLESAFEAGKVEMMTW